LAARVDSFYGYCLTHDKQGLLGEWNLGKNGGLDPKAVLPGSHRKVWWRCECGHEWQAQVRSRVNGNGCPVCANRVVSQGENDLATTHPLLAAQWHRENNGTLTPRDVVAGHGQKVWWQCEKGHAWRAAPQTRTLENTGCPVCAGKVVLPGENDLASHFPRLAEQWDQKANGTLRPHQVTPYSNRRVWWRCEKGHSYQAIIADRTKGKKGCPYCSGRKVLVGFNDLETLEPAIAAQWHDELNGDLTPQMVTIGSNKRVWWQCNLGHVWKTAIYTRTGRGRCGCPVCAGKIKERRTIDSV